MKSASISAGERIGTGINPERQRDHNRSILHHQHRHSSSSSALPISDPKPGSTLTGDAGSSTAVSIYSGTRDYLVGLGPKFFSRSLITQIKYYFLTKLEVMTVKYLVKYAFFLYLTKHYQKKISRQLIEIVLEFSLIRICLDIYVYIYISKSMIIFFMLKDYLKIPGLYI